MTNNNNETEKTNVAKVKTKAEVSAKSMRLVMMEALEKSQDGYLTQEELEALILDRLGHEFGTADHKPMNIKSGREKWKNNLDWAKATATSKGHIVTRTRQRNGRKTTYIVLRPHCKTQQHAKRLAWAQAGKKKNSMTKKCEDCGKYNPLSAEWCVACGEYFTSPTPKRFVVP